MTEFVFEKTSSLPSDLEKEIHQGHIKDEAEKGIVCSYKKFALLLKDSDSQLLGALSAYTAFSEIYIDDIWVKPEHRGQGLGQALLEELEAQFEGQGYNNMNLVTSAFQAPDFYSKCGFELEYVRENASNPQLTKFFFIRFFKNEEQHQGILKC